MDNQDNQQTISDDQELAKVLAGVSQTSDDNNLNFEEINPAADLVDKMTNDVKKGKGKSSVEELPELSNPVPGVDPVLSGIKQTALNELRPLVDKLNISPEEKFDTYLLLIRSTDDKSLIAPAHDVAIMIADETRRAQALLDIIKEIDFLSAPAQ